MSAEAEVSEFSPSMPELAAEHWRDFDAEDRDELVLYRGLILAHASCSERQWLIASSRNDHGLAGVAVGVFEAHPRGRTVLSIRVPALMRRRRAPGVFTRSGEDRERVAGGLVRAMLGAAGERGLTRVALSLCPDEDAELGLAAERLGGRAFPALDEHRIELASDSGLHAYLKALGTRRRSKRNHDLERARRAGAEIAEERLAPALSEELWPLLREELIRFGSPLGSSKNLLNALHDRIGAENLSVTTLRIGSGLLGFVLISRTTTSARFLYLAHVESDDVHVASALWSHSIAAEIARGARTLYLGMTGDVLKHRLGATAHARRHYVFSL